METTTLCARTFYTVAQNTWIWCKTYLRSLPRSKNKFNSKVIHISENNNIRSFQECLFGMLLIPMLLKLHGLIYFRYYRISNNFPCKQIILESYKLSSIYTSRIILLLELEMFKINESNFFMGTQKTNQIHDGNVKKKEPFDFVAKIFEFIQPTCYASL